MDRTRHGKMMNSPWNAAGGMQVHSQYQPSWLCREATETGSV
jgi:hypothetical protein